MQEGKNKAALSGRNIYIPDAYAPSLNHDQEEIQEDREQLTSNLLNDDSHELEAKGHDEEEDD